MGDHVYFYEGVAAGVSAAGYSVLSVSAGVCDAVAGASQVV